MPPVRRPTRASGLVLSPDDHARLAARVVIRFHLRAFAREEAGARTADVEAVHQLRVATRRLRATLRLFAPVLPPKVATRAGGDLKWLGGAIGAVRDLDVLNAAVTARAVRVDPVLRHGLGPLALAIHDERAEAHAALGATLDGRRCHRLLDGLAAFAESTPPARGDVPLGTIAPDLVRPLLRAALRAGRKIGPDAAPEVLHRARIRAKRLRYALETLHGLGGKSVRKMIRQLTRLQQQLGEHQDAVTHRAWLLAYTARPNVPVPTLVAVGALIHAFDRRAAKLRRRVPDRWRRIDRPRFRRGVLEELGAPRPHGVRLAATGT